EMVLSGQINKSIVAQIAAEGGRAVGLSGKDGGLVRVRKLSRTKRDPDSNIEKVIDLGFVGEPDKVDPYILEAMAEKSIIPVVAPIGWDAEGNTYNINADTVAGALAGALNASRLLMLTDVSGVLDKSGTLMSELTVAECKALQEDGTLSGGMIPKIETCVDAVNQGVEGAVIIDGRVPHGVLLELFTEHGSGTLIRR
ncbi:MAG: acetylglutamate kinase, partial [Rickettsiales bacterium]